jgi:hypothetical protein
MYAAHSDDPLTQYSSPGAAAVRRPVYSPHNNAQAETWHSCWVVPKPSTVKAAAWLLLDAPLKSGTEEATDSYSASITIVEFILNILATQQLS